MSDPSFCLHPRWSSLDELVASCRQRHGALRLDLGSGVFAPAGFVGIDNMTGSRAQESADDGRRAPDVLLDLDVAPLPFADAAVDEVRASHVLEHIGHDRLGHVFDEVARVLRPGAPWRIAGPYALSDEGLFPGHATFFTERWFRLNPVFQAHFEIVEEHFDATEEWRALPAIVRRIVPFSLARRHWFNVCHQFSIVAVRRG